MTDQMTYSKEALDSLRNQTLEALQIAEKELLNIYTAIANGNKEAGMNFAANSPAYQAVTAAILNQRIT